MTVISHDESLKDRAVMAAMRAALAVSPAPESKPESRAAYDKLMAQVPIAASVGRTAGEVGGTAGWWCRPANEAPQQAILYLHGGGYVIGSAAAYRGLGSQIAARTGVPTFVADYALAPESPVPAAHPGFARLPA
ncbi:alpha/beta hydrolase [Jiella pacifica]|uniref:Alpha/beta hydrolase fold domain-containing protein n=1 Tax=Jiella pacifica TaxID=2696469 RepID=A0A6N9TBD5_9HYPH|nr:alpha/beta hydrolase [Jiella pacifica]NDW07535.1 alpha/beta hydrolase fold domain-containing protein [Jiella pacifica]